MPKACTGRRAPGLIRNFTGINAPYERPESPDVHLLSSGQSAESLAQQLTEQLLARISPSYDDADQLAREPHR